MNAETAAKEDTFKAAELRDTIQKASVEASTQVSGATAGASSSSAAAASSSPPVASEPIDTIAWESDAKFQFHLKCLAWMKAGDLPPVFVEPETGNPHES